MLTHLAAVDHRGRSCVAVLRDLGLDPAVVFSPEHGLAGVAQAEEPVESIVGDEGAAKVVSLYGKTKDSLAPTKEQLEQIEVLVVDLVDVGSRYYTYVWTALLAAREGAGGVGLVVQA